VGREGGTVSRAGHGVVNRVGGRRSAGLPDPMPEGEGRVGESARGGEGGRDVRGEESVMDVLCGGQQPVDQGPVGGTGPGHGVGPSPTTSFLPLKKKVIASELFECAQDEEKPPVGRGLDMKSNARV